MKRALLYSILICLIVIFSKYFLSNYKIEYKVNNYNVKTIYKDKRFYYEIKNKDYKYNFDFYMDRKPKKTMISKITEIKGENFICIYPTINDVNTYPLCYLDGVYTDYHLIDSELLDTYKEEKVELKAETSDFVLYDNLKSNEYVALWNYKGYILMNGKEYNNVTIFEKDKYDNSLSYQINNIIYMADYNQEHEYTKLITLDITNGKTGSIELEHTLDFDSYFVGNIGKKLYLFDNKHAVLYEIDTKKKKTSIKSNNEMGYVKYEDGEFVSCSKSEYKVDKIKYKNDNSIYSYNPTDEGTFKNIKDNSTIIQKISNNNLNYINESNNKLFYSYEDNFYYYLPDKGQVNIFYSYELTFNSNNTIFVYIK